jgi:REP element-mobilizing transposase RayT
MDWAPKMEPIYTRVNCRFSFPLQWGLTVFWRFEQFQAHWLESLTTALELDGIRILSHRFLDSKTSQFWVSTQPHVAPQRIVQRVKGRLQYLVRDEQPKPFQRNFAIRSLGSEERRLIEEYVGNQTQHHVYADSDFQCFLESLQIVDRSVDLSRMRKTSHGVYWYNLHLVLVHQERWRDANRSRLIAIREMIQRVIRCKGWLLSRAGILPDHIHLAVGCSFNDAPDEVAFGFLNNLAFVHDMMPVFQFGAYVGTFGEYDNRVVVGER